MREMRCDSATAIAHLRLAGDGGPPRPADRCIGPGAASSRTANRRAGAGDRATTGATLRAGHGDAPQLGAGVRAVRWVCTLARARVGGRCRPDLGRSADLRGR
jgi:hypothetical protein